MGLWEEFKLSTERFIFNLRIEKLAFAVLIIIISLLLRQVFVKLAVKLGKKAASNTRFSFNGFFTDVLEGPIRSLIVILGIWLASLVIDFPLKSQLLVDRILRSLVIYILFKTAYRVTDVLAALFEKITFKNDTKLDSMLLLFLRKSLKALIVVIGFVTIIQEWYDNIGGLLAGLGLGGLAFALAARDTVANLFGSITIMIDKTFKIGDLISTSGIEGTVEEIGFRSTRIRTYTQAVVTIPNSLMSNQSITNWSRMGKRRLTFTINLKNNTTPVKIMEFIKYFETLLRVHPEVHPETIIVRLEKLDKSSLGILFYFFTRTTDWEKHLNVQQEINLAILHKISEMELEMGT